MIDISDRIVLRSYLFLTCADVAIAPPSVSQRRWSDMFSCMIAKATVLEEVSTGIAGSRNGALLLVSTSTKQSPG